MSNWEGGTATEIDHFRGLDEGVFEKYLPLHCWEIVCFAQTLSYNTIILVYIPLLTILKNTSRPDLGFSFYNSFEVTLLHIHRFLIL